MKRSVFNVGTIFRHALSSSSKNYADKASTLNVSLILSERRCFSFTLVQAMRRRQLMKNCVRSWWTIPDMLAVGHRSERSDGCDQQGLAEDLISLRVSFQMWICYLNPDYKQFAHRFLCSSSLVGRFFGPKFLIRTPVITSICLADRFLEFIYIEHFPPI